MPKKPTKPTLASNFATNLKAFRLDAKMSQEKLALKAGISVSYVSMLERGLRSPPLDMVEQVAKPLGCEGIALLALPCDAARKLAAAA